MCFLLESRIVKEVLEGDHVPAVAGKNNLMGMQHLKN